MNWKKLFVIFVLTVFVTGIVISGVSATKNSDGSATLKFHVDAQCGADNNIKLSKSQVKHLEQDENRDPINVKVAVETVPAKKKVVKVKVKDQVPVYKYKTKKVTVTKYKTFTDKYYQKNCVKILKKYGLGVPKYNFKNNKVYWVVAYKTKVTKKVRYLHHYKTVYRTAYEYKFYGKKTVYKTCTINRMPFVTDNGGLYALIGTTNGYDAFTIEFDKNFNYKTMYFWDDY